MNRLNAIWMMLLAVGLVFSACQSDDDLTPSADPQHSQWIAMLGSNGSGSSAGPGHLSCYEVVYPISFVLPSGNIVTAEEEGQMLGLLNANPSPIEIVFPVTLVDQDGMEITVEDEDDLQMYLDLCDDDPMDDDDWEDIFGDDDLFECYSLGFPLEVELSDGSTASVMDLDELEALFDEEPYPVAPVFPVILIDEDGNEVEVNSLADLDDLAADCDDDDDDFEWDGPDDFECYELGFPVELELEDGTTAVANNPGELAQILLGDPEPVDFVYPITLIDEDGIEVEVADGSELEDLLEACDDDDDEEGFEEWEDLFDNECYELVYPQEVVLTDNTTEVAMDEMELMAMFDAEPYPLDFVYPVTLVDEDGEEYTAADADELYDLLDEDCDDDDEVQCNHGLMTNLFLTLEETSPDDACYELAYPFTMVLMNGNEETVADADELEDYLDVPGNFAQIECAVFPFDVVDLDNGEVLTVEDPEGIQSLIDDCDD